MPYTITRENGERDLEALKALLARDGMVDSDIDVLQQLADSIEEQVKPAIEEPIEFGSVVRTRIEGLFVRLGAAMALPWGSGGALRRWDQLDVIEVLRVGIGEPPLTKEGIALVLKDLAQWQSDAITAPEKRCYGMAIARVADLLGES